MKRVSIKGVLLGGLVDIISTNIVSISFVVYVMSTRGLLHMPPNQVNAAFIATVHGSIWLYSLQQLIGCGCSTLGGYLSARIARHDELLNGVLSSFLCVAVGIYALATGKVATAEFLLFPFSVLSALAGGYFRMLQQRASTRPTQLA